MSVTDVKEIGNNERRNPKIRSTFAEMLKEKFKEFELRWEAKLESVKSELQIHELSIKTQHDQINLKNTLQKKISH